MKQISLVSAALLFLSAAAENVVVELLPGVPAGWKKLRDASPEQAVRLRVALEQPDLDLFRETLDNISDPDNPMYGHFLSREELREMMKPRDESTSTVLQWLRSSGISEIKDDGDWIVFNTTVAKADSLLDAEFGIYNQDGTVGEALRTTRYSVPEDVRPHITMIQPTTYFGRSVMRTRGFGVEESRKPAAKVAAIPSGQLDAAFCNKTITPECLRALYKVGDYKADPSVKSILGISGFLEEYAKHDALDEFLGTFAPYAVSQNFTTLLINGGLDNQTDTVDDDIEANLDMQYAAALGFESDIRYYSTGGRGPLVPDLDQPDPADIENEPYLEFVTYLLSLPDEELPRTLSTSYGENEQSVPLGYAKRVCNMFGQLGARGVSVLFSSGDEGPGSSCQTNDGKNTTRFQATFPGACPYVTSVGGTVGVEPERAVGLSSGGFSEIFPRPAYQESAVADYLKNQLGETWKGLYNATGRGFPDVAAQAKGFQVMTQGKVLSIGGTSASAPAFAGLVSMLNNARLKQGLPPMGFLNPWLYKVGVKGLTDIVDGGSKGCTGKSLYSGLPTPLVIGASWNATQGWDPATGLGTPLFDQLLELAAPGCQLPRLR